MKLTSNHPIIIEFIAAAKARDSANVQRLAKDSGALCIVDSNNLSAAHYFGVEGDLATCLFLEDCNIGVNIEHFINSALLNKQNAVYEHYLALMPKKNIVPNYNNMATFAVSGGQQDITQHLLNQITDVSKRNYQIVAQAAAHAGYQDMAIYFLNQITDIGKRDYQSVAEAAAVGGHKDMALYFLNQITDVSKRNYQSVADWAERAQQTAVANFFKKLAAGPNPSTDQPTASSVSPIQTSSPVVQEQQAAAVTFTPAFEHSRSPDSGELTRKIAALESQIAFLILQLNHVTDQVKLKEQVIKQLNQQNQEEIAQLKQHIEQLHALCRRLTGQAELSDSPVVARTISNQLN